MILNYSFEMQPLLQKTWLTIASTGNTNLHLEMRHLGMPYKVGNWRFLLQEQYLIEKDPTQHHFFVPNHK